MFRLVIAGCAAVAIMLAEGFTFTIGSPVAAQDFRAKTAAFVFRTQGCPDPGASQISGTAEGLVKGARQSVALKVRTMVNPGVYAVDQNWPADGVWLVNLKGTCQTENAGAIVPLGPKGVIRESSKFVARPATDSEISDSLRALAQGGSK
jgi:hypothetical protein